MRKFLLLALVIILTAFITFATVEYIASIPDYPPNVTFTTIHSSILKEDRELIIHFPVPYDSSKKYPVMYVLDGSSHDWHIANKLEVLSVAGYSPQTIVVGIPNMSGDNRERNLTPPFMLRDNENENSAMGEADSFLAFLEEELIPFMESEHNASSTRLFAGHSRGGLLVIYSLIAKPDLFQARFSFSAPVWRQDNILVKKVADFISTRDTLNTFIFLSAGTNESLNIKEGTAALISELERHTPVGLIWDVVYTPGADHQDNMQKSAAIGIGRWSEYLKATRIKD